VSDSSVVNKETIRPQNRVAERDSGLFVNQVHWSDRGVKSYSFPFVGIM
jgi:hypothetical protein